MSELSSIVERAIASALMPYNSHVGRGEVFHEWIARRCADEATHAALTHVAAYLDACASASVCSRSDFNQGVTRGLEIAAAQVRHGHASNAIPSSDEKEHGTND